MKIHPASLQSEVSFRYSLSSGPGGQNVNKVNTKVTLRWSPEHTTLLTDQEKMRVMNDHQVLARMNSENEVVLQVDESRSQTRNKEIALERLSDLLTHALRVEKKRKPSKPSRGAVKRQQEDERHHREKKARRSWKPED